MSPDSFARVKAVVASAESEDVATAAASWSHSEVQSCLT